MRLERRNMASSDVLMMRPAQAQWSEWTVRKAVKEGYKASTWVYRAVQLIATNAASVPWVVFGKDNQAIWEHRTSMMLAQPNPHFTRAQFFELLVDWLGLCGRAPLKMVRDTRGTAELWPISPDRIAPKASADPTKWIDGYEILGADNVKRMSDEYTAENVLYIKLTDPANPYEGIGPLMAAARAADLDNAAQDWNVATMQNRAVVDGVFSFKRTIDDSIGRALLQKIKERWSGVKKAREPMVLGDDATYTRLGLTPVEMDYLQSRKFSREEIYATFGIPPQLGGSEESSTYNNFSTAVRILWEATIIPIYLDKLKDALNAGLAGELSPGQYIGYDISNVVAMRESEDERAKTAKTYVDMGVPMEQVNEKFELGLKPWEGWDKPAPRQAAAAQPAADEGKRWALRPFEKRGLDEEVKARDDYAEGPLTKAIAGLLEEDRAAVFAALESGAEAAEAAKNNRKAWQKALTRAYMDVATDAAERLLDAPRAARRGLERRDAQQAQDEITAAISAVLQQEAMILAELSLIEASTVQYIIEQVVFAQNNGSPVSAIQQALTDTGAFSPARALRIARTVAGAAMGVGQMTAGAMAGATHKRWVVAGLETRDAHNARAGETVKMDKRFSVQIGSVGPRYPCDPDVAAGDRCNCRCALTFTVEDED